MIQLSAVSVFIEETATTSGTKSEYQSLSIHVIAAISGLMEEGPDLIPFRASVDFKMNMLPRATCLDVELLMEHTSLYIFDEGDILKWLDIAFTLNNQG